MKIVNRLAKDHTTLAVLLGLCPALALTNKFETAYLFIICIFVLLISSYIIILTVGNIFIGKTRVVFDILVIAGLVTGLEYFLKNYMVSIYDAFGIYLPLLAVNLVVLDRVIFNQSKVKRKLPDILRLWVCFGLTVIVVAFIREVLGTGTLTLMNLTSSMTGYRSVFEILPHNNLLPMTILNEPVGAFLIFAFIVALFRYLREERKNESR